MKTLKVLIPAAAFLLLAGQAAAQSQEEAERKEAAATAEAATAKAEAEGLIRQGAMRRPMTWNGGLGLAAAAAIVAVMVPLLISDPQPTGITQPPATQAASQTQVTALQALMVESRQLESDLRAMPQEPRVRQAGTVATISEIEDRIAAIDYQLNDPSITMTEVEEEIFWRERVRLMKLLVGLRYAQAQRTGF